MTTETPFYAQRRALRDLTDKQEAAGDAPIKLSAKSLARRRAEAQASAKVSKKKVSKKTSSESA